MQNHGYGHHGSKGRGCGTGPPHGFSDESTAFRGRGMVNAECADAKARMAARTITIEILDILKK